MPKIVKQLIGRGPAHPFEPSNTKGIERSDWIERINQSLRIIFSTRKGTRLMNPEFGSDLEFYVFDPIDSLLIDKLELSIRRDIELWEPRIVINDIEFKVAPIDIDNNTIYITIRYHIINTDVEGNFVFPFRTGTRETYARDGEL